MDEKKIREFFSKSLLKTGQAPQFSDDEMLMENGRLDSLFVVDLIIFLENEFDVSFQGDALRTVDLGSFSKVVAVLGERLKVKS